MEFLQDRRKQQGKSRTCIDADAHRDEHDGDNQPAVVEREAHERDRFSGLLGPARGYNACALSLRNASVAAIDTALPVAPMTADVIDTSGRAPHKAGS